MQWKFSIVTIVPYWLHAHYFTPPPSFQGPSLVSGTVFYPPKMSIISVFQVLVEGDKTNLLPNRKTPFPPPLQLSCLCCRKIIAGNLLPEKCLAGSEEILKMTTFCVNNSLRT